MQGKGKVHLEKGGIESQIVFVEVEKWKTDFTNKVSRKDFNSWYEEIYVLYFIDLVGNYFDSLVVLNQFVYLDCLLIEI